MKIDSRVNLNTINQPHPAVSEEFDLIYSKLKEKEQDGTIRVSKEGDLELFTYSNECRSEYMWDRYSIMSRGLILDPKNRRVVAMPFLKFFNYGETPCELPKLPFEVTEKVDGSLGILYYYNGQWNVATKGSFNSAQARWAKRYLDQKINTEFLSEDATYLLEIIFPENRIVINYQDREDLVLLSAYDKDGYELGTNELDDLAIYSGFSRPKIFKYDNIQDLLILAQKMPKDEEGFVVRFTNGFRVKIKGDEYVRIHRVLSSVTPLAIWRSMSCCDNLEPIQKELPEEVLKDFNAIVDLLNQDFKNIYDSVDKLHQDTKHLTDKEVAEKIRDDMAIPYSVKRFIFEARKKDFFAAALTNCRVRKAVFESFKPKGNVLHGYTPTSAMNRFEELEI